MRGRTQSESVGAILLTVVGVATLGGAVLLGGVSEDVDRGSAPLVEVAVEMTVSDVAVTHAGGAVVAQSALTLITRGESATERYGVDAGNVSGDGDGSFEERSATVTFDGSGSYDVTGLSTESRRYRLRVELRTDDPVVTPTVGRLELRG